MSTVVNFEIGDGVTISIKDALKVPHDRINLLTIEIKICIQRNKTVFGVRTGGESLEMIRGRHDVGIFHSAVAAGHFAVLACERIGMQRLGYIGNRAVNLNLYRLAIGQPGKGQGVSVHLDGAVRAGICIGTHTAKHITVTLTQINVHKLFGIRHRKTGTRLDVHLAVIHVAADYARRTHIADGKVFHRAEMTIQVTEDAAGRTGKVIQGTLGKLLDLRSIEHHAKICCVIIQMIGIDVGILEQCNGKIIVIGQTIGIEGLGNEFLYGRSGLGFAVTGQCVIFAQNIHNRARVC